MSSTGLIAIRTTIQSWLGGMRHAVSVVQGCIYRSRLIAFVVCAMMSLVLPSAVAQEESSEETFISREYPLKALFVYNFGSYVDWPAASFSSKDAPFVIGILGPSPIDKTLRSIAATKKIGDRTILVEQFSAVDKIKPCQILFIPRTVSKQEQQAAIDFLKNQATLIVGESSGFADEGGTINFFVEANKIRFEVNVAATKRRQLKVSSKLLAIARIVDGGNSDSTKR